ncbi:G-protein coupled receptor Mth2 [Chionoecetes opilio]|uniref:G-protein coupled receptor Mth2 n=1 Tax=Chionoecetes opilio TaxID=41210 RepID=A0A8J5CPE9_CHIOP|nr:G-protein coupled receptor Mth2 [Chionoecetes opilio]
MTHMMEQWRRVAVVMCVSMLWFRGAATQNVSGRCCSAGKGGDGSCHEIPQGDFLPPMADISWVTQDLDCPPTHSIVYYDLNSTLLNTDNHFIIMEDELVMVYRPRHLFDKETLEYCIEARGEQQYRGGVCQPDPGKMCDNAVCVPKCCGEGEILQDFICTRGTGNLSLEFYTYYGRRASAPSDVVIVGDMVPDCKDGFPGFKEDISHLHVLVNGKLMQREDQIIHEINRYCIEDMYVGDVYTKLFLVCSEAESENGAISVKHHLQRLGYVISVVFLIITIICHICIPCLHDTQGLCLIAHMVSMGMTDIFLFILSLNHYDISWELCNFIAFALHYSFLALFFWLNIMCFDIWRVIRFWQRFSLFILMVLCWTTDILSWKIPPRELWILSDFVNSLQGLLVFIIFLSNRKRRELVRNLSKQIPSRISRRTRTTHNRAGGGAAAQNVQETMRAREGAAAPSRSSSSTEAETPQEQQSQTSIGNSKTNSTVVE